MRPSTSVNTRAELKGTEVDCSAADAHNNTASGSFTVKVQDINKPVLTVPADITAEATGPTGASVSYTGVSAHDDIDGDIPASCIPVSGSTVPLGSTTVNCSEVTLKLSNSTVITPLPL
jgi:hypothetical protein